MNRDVARGQDIGKEGGGGAVRVGWKVGDTTCGSGPECVLCVCIVRLHPVSCVLNVISPFTVARSFN